MKMRKHGFTLVELLVVIAIIGVMIGLLLPAVQSAREAARRMQCGNNIRNLSLAMMSYESSYKRFPAGVVAVNPLAIGAFRANGTNASANNVFYNGMWSWSAYILPFMEGQSVFNQINFNARPWAEELGDAWFFDQGADSTASAALNKAVASLMPPSFACPSTPESAGPGKYKDYAMNGGQGRNGRVIRYSGTSPISACCPERATTANGIGFKNSWIRISQITDGTSNTFLLLEQASRIPKWRFPTNPFVFTSHQSQGLSLSNSGDMPFPPNQDPVFQVSRRGSPFSNGPGLGLTGRCSRSWHVGGVETAMADGSVRFVSNFIAGIPWRAMHTRDGGEVFTIDE